jgi:hypothetical protein
MNDELLRDVAGPRQDRGPRALDRLGPPEPQALESAT